MKRTQKVRNGPRQNFDIHYPEQLSDLYADGVADALLGFPNSKISFYQIRSGDEGERKKGAEAVEQRELAAVLTLPTLVLLDFCRNILAAAQSNPGAMHSAIEEHKNALLRAFESGFSSPAPSVLKASLAPDALERLEASRQRMLASRLRAKKALKE